MLLQETWDVRDMYKTVKHKFWLVTLSEVKSPRHFSLPSGAPGRGVRPAGPQTGQDRGVGEGGPRIGPRQLGLGVGEGQTEEQTADDPEAADAVRAEAQRQDGGAQDARLQEEEDLVERQRQGRRG